MTAQMDEMQTGRRKFAGRGRLARLLRHAGWAAGRRISPESTMRASSLILLRELMLID